MMIQIVIFYILVGLGLAIWGKYLCQVADRKEELFEKALASINSNKNALRQPLLEDREGCEDDRQIDRPLPIK